jgi:SNF2 family DNA or RNA helicase
MFAEIGGHDIEAMNAASRVTKAAQIASGACYVDADGNLSDEPQRRWTEVHTALLDALESVVTEAAGMPVLVAYQWKHDLERLQKAFPRGRVLDDDPRTIEDWNAGRIPVLFAHPASAGHGLNLQHGGNIIAFFGLWWDLELYQQILERIGPVRQLQAGYDRPVFIYHIVARGTVHELMAARMKSKAIGQDGLLAAMRREA